MRRQKAIAEKEDIVKAKARAADERKRAEKREAVAKKKASDGCLPPLWLDVSRQDEYPQGCLRTPWGSIGVPGCSLLGRVVRIYYFLW